LEYLERLKGLKVLELSGTQVTEEGLRSLQQALPGCGI
jgi:hypothetical protein